jgi:aspartyl-tRNA(Asn)/glutamyl-tRNA(Gln) amidotransferase subunit B
MRSKEQAHDYRYFPEPDLVPVVVDEQWREELRAALPELGLARKRRFIASYGLPAYDAGILVDDVATADYYEEACAFLGTTDADAYKAVSNWIMTELLRIMGQRKCGIRETGMSAEQLASLVMAVHTDVISNKTAKDIFPTMIETGKKADVIIEEQGLRQVSDTGAIKALVDKVIADNPDNLEKYRNGKTNLFGFFVGQVLKASGGSANPSIVSSMMKEALDGVAPQ